MNQKELLIQAKNENVKESIVIQDWDKRKADLVRDYERKLRDVEMEESRRLNKEIETFKRELANKLEREKMVAESTRRSKEEDISIRLVQLREQYRKKLEAEKQKLYEDNERSIRELQEIERRKLEESSARTIENNLRMEYEKKFNDIDSERIAMLQQHKKKLDELKFNLEKKLDADKIVRILYKE